MIVWLASYPRSGNTLLRILLQRAFGLSTWSLYNDDGDIAKDKAFADLVGHQSHDGNTEKLIEKARAADEPYLIKTHDAPIDDEKAIFVLREGQAAIVSFYHYLKNHSIIDYEMDDVITGAVPYGSWSDHVKSWDPLRRPDTLFLKFEEMRDKPEDALQKISSFLSIAPVGDGEVKFEELKQVSPQFFRSGSNASNRSELSEDQHALFNTFHGQIAEEFGYPVGGKADAVLLGAKLAEQSARFWDAKLIQRKNRQAEKQLDQLRKSISFFPELRRLSIELSEDFENSDLTLGTIESLIQKIRNKINAQNEELSTLRRNLQFRRARIERTEAQLEKLQTKFREKDEKHKERLEMERRAYSVMEKKHSQVSAELASLSKERETLASELSRASKRLNFLDEMLAPRLKTIVTLRPLRYVINERNRLKKMGVTSRDEALSVDAFFGQSGNVHAVEYIPTSPAGKTQWPGFGIAVFGFTRVDCIQNTLESLARQDAISVTHVFLDGDQGRPDVRRQIDLVHEAASAYPVKQIHRQRGGFGFRKMMLIAGKYMQSNYERMLFLEDDCFPVDRAISDFNVELNAIENDESVFSVYGHPFLVDGEDHLFSRFQGWGWATTRDKIGPIWRELEQCYLMSEPEYLSYVREKLTPEIARRIDVTPGRQPTSTLRKFFAWDETVCLLTALKGQQHKPSRRRLIYNCGAGLESSHFKNLTQFRRPPFNMIGADEVWRYFQP